MFPLIKNGPSTRLRTDNDSWKSRTKSQQVRGADNQKSCRGAQKNALLSVLLIGKLVVEQ